MRYLVRQASLPRRHETGREGLGLAPVFPDGMRQQGHRASRGIQAGKGSGWGKGRRNESLKKGGPTAGANVMSWDKYGH